MISCSNTAALYPAPPDPEARELGCVTLGLGGHVSDEAPRIIEGADGQLAIEVDEDEVVDANRRLVAPPPASGDQPPRLRALQLRNFKGFADFTIELGDFNVLAGANNAGKSSVLQGMNLISTLLRLHLEGDGLADRGRTAPVSIFPVANLRDLWHARATRKGNTPVAAEVGAEFSDGSHVRFGIRSLFGGANSRVESQAGMDGERLRALLAHPIVWVPSAVGIVRDEEYRTPARREALLNAGRHNEVLRNYIVDLRNNRPERFERLLDILRARFDATLEDVNFDESLDQFVSLDYRSGEVRHDLFSAGSGFIQVVQLLLFVLSKDAGVVVLDEPDAHLHSSMQRIVVEILEDVARSQGFQVVTATHSKEIINFVDPSRLILVEPGAQTAAPVSDVVTPMTVLKSLGSIDNVDAYALLKNRRVFFVEGKTDELVLGRMAATLGLHLFTGDDRIVCLAVGGADKFEHVSQLDVIEGLLDRKLATLEVRDRDARLEERCATLAANSPRGLHVWSRDSIESYLVEPRVIARTVNSILRERGRPETATPEAIEHLIGNLCEELRDETTDRVAQRLVDDAFRFDSERLAVQSANETAREVVRDAWPTLETRLQFVSGKRLLAALRAGLPGRVRGQLRERAVGRGVRGIGPPRRDPGSS